MAERNRLEQVHNPPEETVSNDDIDMTGESLAVDNSASFRNLKDFPVVSNELTYSTSTPHYKEQPLADLVADESSLENESNLTKKHSEIHSIVSSYQIIDLNILASTYSAIAYPDCFNRSCIELKKAKKNKTGTFIATLFIMHNMWISLFFLDIKESWENESYDINKRSVYAFRRLGKGYAGMKTFLT